MRKNAAAVWSSSLGSFTRVIPQNPSVASGRRGVAPCSSVTPLRSLAVRIFATVPKIPAS